jgi:hypothetical protein
LCTEQPMFASAVAYKVKMRESLVAVVSYEKH